MLVNHLIDRAPTDQPPPSTPDNDASMLLGVAQASQALMRCATLDDAITSALAALGQAIGVDRIGVFENHPQPESPVPAISQRWAWVSPEMAPAIIHPDQQNLTDTTLFPRWHEALSHHQPIVGCVKDFPAYEQIRLAPQGIVALLVIPIWDHDDDFWGFIALDDCHQERAWSALTIAALQTIATSIGNTMKFHDFADTQNQLEQQLRQQIQISNCQTQIGTVLTQSQDLPHKLKHCTDTLVNCLDVAFARIWTISDDGTTLELQASSGLYTHIDGDHARVPVGKFKIGLIAEERQPHLTNQVLSDPRVGDKAWAAREGMIAFAGYPLMVEGRILGVIALFARQPLDDSILNLLNGISQSISLNIYRDQTEAKLRKQTATLQATLTELQQTQAHLIQSEKMSSLGEMVAGVAHEINNPVNFIHGNLNHVRNYSQDLIELTQRYHQELKQPSPELAEFLDEVDLPFLLEDFPKILDSMKTGTQRIREIVLTLRNFSRLDEAEMKDVNIHDGINSTILILQNKIKSTDERPHIKLDKQYGDLPHIYCYASQLNQVFMNILANAIDALDTAYPSYLQRGMRDYQPAITIATTMTPENTVQIAIKDNGPGIPAAVQARLFDPFFTTKPVGQGTGLGLSISYQIIVEKHQGQLTCHSIDGEGTTFTITLPLLEPAPEPGQTPG